MLQSLFLWFRERYLSFLKPYQIDASSSMIDSVNRTSLPDWLNAEFDIIAKNHLMKVTYKKYEIHEPSKESDMAWLNKSNLVQKEQLVGSTHVLQKPILYIIQLPEAATAVQARYQINTMGFAPANLLEMVLFVQQYDIKNLARYSKPLIALNAFHNFCGSVKTGSITDAGACLQYQGDGEFVRPWEIESGELLEGSRWINSVSYLVKAFEGK